MCGHVGMLTSSSAKDGGGSSTAVVGSAELLATDKKNGDDSSNSPSGGNLYPVEEGQRQGQQTDACPACEAMFGNLAGTEQHVELQLRGVSRPKRSKAKAAE